MQAYKIYITESAENDLRDIVGYISFRLDAQTTVMNMMRTIKTALENLKTTALSYPLVRDDRLAAIGYRLISVKNYIVFYIVDEKSKTIDVDRILYGRRDWRNLLQTCSVPALRSPQQRGFFP